MRTFTFVMMTLSVYHFGTKPVKRFGQAIMFLLFLGVVEAMEMKTLQ